jgi:hypothetical protein
MQPQIVIDPIDRFRADFYDNLIQEETKMANDEKLKQTTCYHQYSIMEPIYQQTYQQRTCAKCGHSAVKRVTVWEGSKHCIIS